MNAIKKEEVSLNQSTTSKLEESDETQNINQPNINLQSSHPSPNFSNNSPNRLYFQTNQNALDLLNAQTQVYIFYKVFLINYF